MAAVMGGAAVAIVAELAGKTVSPMVAADMTMVAAAAKVETQTNIDLMSSASTLLNFLKVKPEVVLFLNKETMIPLVLLIIVYTAAYNA